DGTYSFLLTNNDGNSVFYYSKEAANFHPELVIYTSGSGTPTVTATTPVPTTTTPTATTTTPTATTTTPTVTATTPVPTTTPPTTTPPPGGQIVLSPVADTHVKTDRATSNYGSEPYVRVRQTASVDYDSYFKFNVSGTGGQVSAAVLRLYSYDGGPDGGTLYQASNNYLSSSTPWTESGLTWNNAPGPMGSALDSAGNVNDGSWVELNVTSAITGDGTYSFLLTSNDGNSVFYYSKEANSLRPELVIYTSGGPAPSATTPVPTTTTPTVTATTTTPTATT